MSRGGKRTHLMFPALALPNREGRITSPVIGTGRGKDLFTRSAASGAGAKGVLFGAAMALGAAASHALHVGVVFCRQSKGETS